MGRPEFQVPLVLVSLALATWVTLSYFRANETPTSISILIYICWCMGFAGLFLLPFDIADVQTYGEAAPWIGTAWRLTYWTTFIITWAVLPTVYGYLESGYFNVKDRLFDALHQQIRFAVLATVGFVCFFIYLLAQQYTLAGVEGFLIASGNTYGLLMIVVLLGNGIIELPRRTWASSFTDKELQRLYLRASMVDSTLHDAVCVLTDVEAEVLSLREQLRLQAPEREGQAALEEAMRLIEHTRESFAHRPEDMAHGMLLPGRRAQAPGPGDAPMTLDKMAVLHARLKTAQLRVQVFALQRSALIEQVEEAEALADGSFRYPESVKGTGGICSRIAEIAWYLLAVLSWYYKVWVRPWLMRGLAVVCWATTLCLLWSEVVLGSPLALSPFGALLQSVGEASPFALEIATALPLLYLSICTYRSLFKFKLFGDFSLQGPRQSLPRPLLVNAQYLIRLQFPLAYNFLLLLRNPSSKRTAFRHLMNNMSVVPLLGSDFNTYAPLLMVVLAAFTFFRGYARLLRLAGIQHEDCLSPEEQEEMITQGRSLVRRRRYTNQPSSSRGSDQEMGLRPLPLGRVHNAYVPLREPRS